MKCAEILLPLPIKSLFTYIIPDNLIDGIEVGVRVVVPFGKKKYYSGVVAAVRDVVAGENTEYELKSILFVLDSRPIVNESQLFFWKWIASYYIANLGDVMNVALPSLMKVTSETFIVINSGFSGDVSDLPPETEDVLQALLYNKKLSVAQLSSLVQVKNIYKFIQSLVIAGAVDFLEEVNNPYKPKIEEFISLTDEYQNDEALSELFDKMEKKSYKQLQFLLAYLKCAGNVSGKYPFVMKKDIYKEISPDRSIINALLKKNVITIEKRKVDRLERGNSVQNVEELQLTDAQQKVYHDIKTGFVDKNIVLLHGVTSSGKTEVYIKLIQDTLIEKRQVLILLPDIAITTQIVMRITAYFGKKVGVYHSKFNHNEKVEVWNSVLDNNEVAETGYNIIIGTRSSIFLPFNNLGLIIIDDEHDYSYKQSDVSPRYNTRDCAVYMAGVYKAKVLLCSATPSIETYFNTKNGRYGLVTLNERYGGLQLPEINVVDMKDEHRKKSLVLGNYSIGLIDEIRRTLAEKRQVLIFQNRRGFALRLECDLCGWVPTCPNCDVALIYHKSFNQMRCHYCGFYTPVYSDCPKCKGNSLSMKGYGTEKVEEELQSLFPEATIRRMDLDTTRRKNAFTEILSEFSMGKIDILVGTQMVIKGLNFENISLVGVINTDSLLYFPDFRAFERAFQDIVQVSGRAGRKKDRGKVILQTYSPYHSAIVYALDNDYQKMYQSQILDRQTHKYPPVYRLISVKIKHKDYEVVNSASAAFAMLLRQELGNRVLGPEYASIPRINDMYIKNILIKIERSKVFQQIKDRFISCYESFIAKPEYRNVRVIVDVDPY